MAIARDTTSTGEAAGTLTVTVAHTCTGSNLVLITYLECQDGDFITGVTYNSVAMTQLKKSSRVSNPGYVYLYGLVNPATGAHNVVATRSTTTFSMEVINSSYTGVSQTGLPDASNSSAPTGVSSTSLSVTTVANNAWAVLGIFGDAPTASTNSTLVATAPYTNNKMFDNQTYGAITPAGSFSMSVTFGSSNNPSLVMVSLAPVAVATLAARKSLLGVGI